MQRHFCAPEEREEAINQFILDACDIADDYDGVLVVTSPKTLEIGISGE